MATTVTTENEEQSGQSVRNTRKTLATMWAARGFFGGLLAFGIAFIGQLLFLQNQDDPLAFAFYGIAIVVLILSLAHPRASEKSLHVSEATQPIRPQSKLLAKLKNRRSVIVTGLALTLSLAAIAMFLLLRSASDPLGGWLWLASVIILLITFAVVDLMPHESNKRSLHPLLPGPLDDYFGRGVPRISPSWEAWCIIIILVAGLALRLYNLPDHPVIFGDEGERGLSARAINEGATPNIFGFGWWGVPNLYFYVVAPMLIIFGDDMIGDRMLSVISGLVAVWYVYRIGRLFWGPRAGLLAGAMLSLSTLAIHFSRVAGESTPTGALWAAGFYYLFLAMRNLRWRDWALSGLIFGLSLYTYASAKLIVPLLVLVGLYCLIRWRMESIRRYAAGFLLLGLIFIIVFMPNAIVIVTDPEGINGFAGRAQETSIFTPENQPEVFAMRGVAFDPAIARMPLLQSLREYPEEWAQVLWGQVVRSVDVIYRVRDGTEFYPIALHNGSMLPPFWAMLAVLGLAYGLWKIWDPRFGLLDIWFWGGMLAVILTINTPSVQRITGAWPALILYPAALLDRVFVSAWPLSMKLARRWATVPLVAMLAFFTIDSYQEYFVYYPTANPLVWNVHSNYVRSLGQDYKAYQFGRGDHEIPFDYGVTRFVAKGVEGRNTGAPVAYLPLAGAENTVKGASFMVMPWNEHYLPILRLFYPEGIAEPVEGLDGKTYFMSYKIPQNVLAQYQTTEATYKPSSGETKVRKESGLGTSSVNGAWMPPQNLGYPARATWEGNIVAPSYGAYSLELAGSPNAQLEVDGNIVLDNEIGADVRLSGTQQANNVALVLAKGIHHIRLRADLKTTKDRIELRWGSPGAPTLELAPSYLYSGPSGGLGTELSLPWNNERLLNPEPDQSFTITNRVTFPAIGFSEATEVFGEEDFGTRSTGTLYAPTSGDYGFRLICGGRCALIVDGGVVLQKTVTDGSAMPIDNTIRLSKGRHDVDLRYAFDGGLARLEWFWKQPGGEWELVPTNVLDPGIRSWPRSQVPDAPLVQFSP